MKTMPQIRQEIANDLDALDTHWMQTVKRIDELKANHPEDTDLLDNLLLRASVQYRIDRRRLLDFEACAAMINPHA